LHATPEHADFAKLPLELIDAAEIAASVPSDVPALRLRMRPSDSRLVRLCAVGDIGLSGRAAMTARQRGADQLLGDVRSLLQSADITFGNLESPLAEDIAPAGQFAAPRTGAITLRQAGFDVVHLANNHVGEYGQAGLAATLQAVEDAGLRPLGAGSDMSAARRIVRTDCGGLRIGWLGCGRTLLPQTGGGPCYWEFDEQELLDEVRRVRSALDVLIVSIHIGLMYVFYPRPEHKAMAERLMAAGVDLILMHHAHVLQGVQATARGAMCCYNLGNFLYDWEEGNVRMPVVVEEQNEGGIFVFDFDRHGLSSFAFLPTWIDSDCCARWATGNRGLRIVNRFEQITSGLAGDFVAEFERQRAARNTAGIVKVLAFNASRGNWGFVASSLRRMRWEHVKMALRWITAS
jgi:poly-gamma-glutamate synthesis protein (capsule biosynthesis protein)